jgi:CRP-like cAMP-binding protein
MNSDERRKWDVRNTPVTDAKYKDVWKRLRIKIRTKRMLGSLGREILLFGTGVHQGGELDDMLSVQIERLVKKKDQKTEPEEDELAEKVPWYLLNPKSPIRSLWNILVILLLVYTATVMPFKIAYYSEEIAEWRVFEWVLDSLFFSDILVTCISAHYTEDGRLVVSLREIFLKYLRSWMLLDIVSCFPFDMATTDDASAKYNNLLRLVRLPRLYRLLRVARVVKMCKSGKESEIMERLQDFLSIKHTAVRLCSFFTSVFVCVHLVACFWYFTARVEDFTPDTWVANAEIQDSNVATLYITCIYWAFTTLCTVGYGDIVPTTDVERLLAVGWMIFGVYFFSFTIGSLSSILSSIDTKETILTTKLAIIDEFVRDAHLDRSMRNRLRTSIKYNSEKEGYSLTDKQDLFYELPKSLRHEVAMVMHQGVVKELPFFTERDPMLAATVVPFLQHLFVKSGSPVYQEKDYADEIYFIVKGWCGVVYGSEHYLVKKLQRGSYFGDIEVIESLPRKYTVMAAVDTDLLTMGKKLLATVQHEFPTIYQDLVAVADTRDKLNLKAIMEHKELVKLKKEKQVEGMNLQAIKESIQSRANKRIEKQMSSNPGSPAVAKDSELYKQIVDNEARIAALERDIEEVYRLVADQKEVIAELAGHKRPSSLSPVGGEGYGDPNKKAVSFKQQ